MLPASFAAVVPVFMATPTSACASAGASFVPSPVIATMRPFACSSLIRAIFVSGVASARKSSTPDSCAITAAVTRLSPVIITVRIPILRSSSKRSFMPPLTMSFRWMTPSAQLSRATTSGVPPCSATPWTIASSSAGALPPRSVMNFLTASAAPLRISVPFMFDAAHARRRAERDEVVLSEDPLAQIEALLRQHDDRTALGRLVGERRELRHLGQLELLDARHRQELRRLAVAERDRAGLVQQEHVDVAGGLDRAAGHGEDVALHEPVHPGDADRREERADRRRDQRDEQRDQHGLRHRRAGVERVRPQRHDGGEEGDGQAREKDVQRDLVRRLAPLGALDERDHPVEERLARLLRHLDHEPVREQLRAAGDGRAVAARLADHRRRLSGDGRLVDRADALDDLAVGRDDHPGLDDDDVALLRGPPPPPPRACRRRAGGARSSSCASRAARPPAPCPRPSAIASAKFAKSTVSQSQNAITPTNASELSCPRARSRKKITVVMTLPSSTMNITGFLNCFRGSSFGNESRIAATVRSREKMLALWRAITVRSPCRVRG